MAALGDRVPHQDVAVEPVRLFAGLLAGIGDPVVVVGGAHLVRIAILQRPADADDEDWPDISAGSPSRAACAAGRDTFENFFGMQEHEVLGQVWDSADL